MTFELVICGGLEVKLIPKKKIVKKKKKKKNSTKTFAFREFLYQENLTI